MSDESMIVTAVGLGVLGTAIYLAYNFVSQGRKAQEIATLKGALDTTTGMVESSAEMMKNLLLKSTSLGEEVSTVREYSTTLEDTIRNLRIDLEGVRDELADKVVIPKEAAEYLLDEVGNMPEKIVDNETIQKIVDSYNALKDTGYSGTGAFATEVRDMTRRYLIR